MPEVRAGRAPRVTHLAAIAACTPWSLRCGPRMTATAVFTFRAHVEQVLVPALRRGDVVVLDNLAAHKQPEVRQAIEGGQCALRCLAPYSSDFNPIEMAFAKTEVRSYAPGPSAHV